jgi:Arc/MetJ-type ribon-helix-helix transcriptional regulator
MARRAETLSDRTHDNEKVSINLGFVDLGRIDLMVAEGFYSNRTDFIRAAIRKQLEIHSDEVKQSIVRQTLQLGMRVFTREDLESIRAAGEKLNIKVVGLAQIADDVSVELALATIDAVQVLGAFHASPEVKAALAKQGKS